MQYLAPLFVAYASQPDLDVKVFYASDRGARGAFDSQFAKEVRWDIPLLDGYSNAVLEPAMEGWRHPLQRVRRTLFARLCTGDFDLIISYGYNHVTALWSFAAARVARVPWAFVTDSHTLESADGRIRRGKRTFLKALGRGAHAILAGSRKAAEFYRPFAPGKVHLLPHAIEESRFASAGTTASRAETRERFGASEDDVVYLFAGKLTRNKRVGDLILAVADNPHASVWIVGTGPEEAQLRALAAPLGERVRFLGFVNQSAMPAVYSAADVVVLPSQHETFGLVVSEGAALSKPAIVSSSCGVVGSLVLDRNTGRVVEPGDVGGLGHAIRELLDPGIRARMGREMSREFRNWTTEANVRAFKEICHRVIG